MSDWPTAKINIRHDLPFTCRIWKENNKKGFTLDAIYCNIEEEKHDSNFLSAKPTKVDFQPAEPSSPGNHSHKTRVCFTPGKIKYKKLVEKTKGLYCGQAAVGKIPIKRFD